MNTEEQLPLGAYNSVKLKRFHINNKHSYLMAEDGKVEVHNLWSVNGLRFVFDEKDQNNIDLLNDIVVDSRFDAIIDSNFSAIEFIFTFVDKNDKADPSNSRLFTTIYRGEEYKCHFSESSEKVMFLARSMKRSPDEENRSVVPQLRMFRDYQIIESAPQHIQDYFKGKHPVSFFVEGPLVHDFDIIKFSQYLNMVMKYYDRTSPSIVIRQDDSTAESVSPERIAMGLGEFPKRLNLPEIDEVILTLLESARLTTPRFAYIYYYQVFEYAGFYYLDQKLKAEARRIILDPSFACATDETINELLSILSDRNHNDDVKMIKVIEDLCAPAHTWPEIYNDIDFFSSKVTFDGGFELPPLVHKDITPDAWETTASKIFPLLTKLRNCIVHARERRENKVVLPTKENNRKIARIIPLIRRMAEDIAIQV